MAKKIIRTKANNKDLTKKAEENTTITKTKDRQTTVVKEGTPLDHTPTHNINKHNSRTVGVNVGITKNMGDYESLRVDCWLTDDVLEGETHSQALERVSAIAVESLTRQVEELSAE